MTDAHPTISIDLALDRHTTKEVLRAVLHAILFHRLFGTVKAKTFEVADVTVPGVDDAGMIQLVDEKVDAFWKGIEGRAHKRGQIIVTFSEKRPRRTWLFTGEEEIPWEQWIINAEIRQPTTEEERRRFNENLTATLTKNLQLMLVHASSERGRSAVPVITRSEGLSPFPFKIAVKVDGVEVA